jgi:hypothetical protein
MGRILKAVSLSQCVLAICFLSMFTAIGLNIYLYVQLHQAWPLEHFNGHILTPVDLSIDKTIVATGTFNRRVACEMYDFTLQLRNITTKDIIILTPEHLATAPTTTMSPANNIDVNFSLFIPGNIYAGFWAPTFTGNYICKSGIFTQNKTQRIVVDSFEVINSK